MARSSVKNKKVRRIRPLCRVGFPIAQPYRAWLEEGFTLLEEAPFGKNPIVGTYCGFCSPPWYRAMGE